MKSNEEILNDLNYFAPTYDLDGVEFTNEDAEHVKDLMDEGETYEKAMQHTLNEIRDVLSENWEF